MSSSTDWLIWGTETAEGHTSPSLHTNSERDEGEAVEPASDGREGVVTHLGVDQQVQTEEVEEGDYAGGEESG